MTHFVKGRRLCRHAAAALLVAIAVFAPAHAAAAAFDVNDTTWEGCSELFEIASGELGAARVEAVAVLNWDEVHAEDGVLVLHPTRAMDADEQGAFMKAGGRLAMLDDYGVGDDTLNRLKIFRVAPPSRPVNALRNRAALPIAQPVIDKIAGRETAPHAIVARVKQLVTNHPTGLRKVGEPLTNVLIIKAIGEPDVILAMAGVVGKGRLFAMGDPSAVINQMLRYPGNRDFVLGLVHYLVDDDGPRHRQGKLYIVANRFREEGSFGGRNSARHEIESFFRSLTTALSEMRDAGLPWWMHLIFAAFAVLAVSIWVGRSSARIYKSPLPRYARPTPLVAQGGVAGRFAMLAAPRSPLALAVLELKNALFEGAAARLGLEAEPSGERLVELARGRLKLDDEALKRLQEALALMQRAEAGVVAGRRVRVPPAALKAAAAAVQEVLDACEPAGLPWAGSAPAARPAERATRAEGEAQG